MDPRPEYNRIITEMTRMADRATAIEARAIAARAVYEPLRDTYVANGTGGPALAVATTDLQHVIDEFNTLPVAANLDYHQYLEAKKGVVRNRFDQPRQAVYADFIAQYDAQSTRFQQIYDRLLADLMNDTATIDSEFIDILRHPGSYNLANIRDQKLYMRQISEYNDTQCQIPVNNLNPDQIIAQLGAITYANIASDSNVYKQVACGVKSILRNNRDAVLRILNARYIPVEDPIIQNFFNPREVLSDASVEGVVWRIGYSGSAGYFATMKTSKRDPANTLRSYNMLHELLVGLILNFLRPFTPNFMYVWGGFSCSSPTQGAPLPAGVATASVRHAHNFGTLCTDNTPDNMDVLMLNENVAVFDTFHGTFERARSAAAARAAGAPPADLVRWADILYILFQIIISLAMAQAFCKFVHGDLHDNNVLVKRLPADVTLEYILHGVTYRVQTRYIAVIIDYGFSRVTSVDTLPNGDRLPPGGPPIDTNMPPLRYAWDGAGDIFAYPGEDRPENEHYRRFMPLYDIARVTTMFGEVEFALLNNVLDTGFGGRNVSRLFNRYLRHPRAVGKSAVFDAPRGVDFPMEVMAANMFAELPVLVAHPPRGFI